MITIIRDFEDGQLIPDAKKDTEHYHFDELDGAVLIDSDDVTGAETYRLADGRVAVLQSIDLDWVHDGEERAVIRTTSAPELYK